MVKLSPVVLVRNHAMRAKQLSQSAFIQDLALLARYDLTNLELGIKLRQDSRSSCGNRRCVYFRRASSLPQTVVT